MKNNDEINENNEINENKNKFRFFPYFRLIRNLTSFLVLAVVTVYAHPAPFSYLDLRLNRAQEGQIEGVLVVHVIDVAHDLSVTPPEILLDPVQLESKKDAI